jgi:hypothetical protein
MMISSVFSEMRVPSKCEVMVWRIVFEVVERA